MQMTASVRPIDSKCGVLRYVGHTARIANGRATKREARHIDC
jgi:hypothetical protein